MTCPDQAIAEALISLLGLRVFVGAQEPIEDLAHYQRQVRPALVGQLLDLGDPIPYPGLWRAVLFRPFRGESHH